MSKTISIQIIKKRKMKKSLNKNGSETTFLSYKKDISVEVTLLDTATDLISKVDDIVRTVQKCTEVGRNDQSACEGNFVSLQVTECNLENEVVKYLGGECKFTIDHYGIDLILDAAINGAYIPNKAGTDVLRTPADAITGWTATLNPTSGEPWLWRKHINFVPSHSNMCRKVA